MTEIKALEYLRACVIEIVNTCDVVTVDHLLKVIDDELETRKMELKQDGWIL